MELIHKPWLLHPIAVHFPIALLNVGLLTALWSRWSKRAPWTSEAASWLLWLGTLAAWVALGLGALAEDTAPHVPAAWQALDHHEDLAYWTVGLFTALSILRWLMRRSSHPHPLPKGEGQLETSTSPLAGEGRVRGNLFLLVWFFACGLLLATAYFGGHLVYAFGMGVVPSAGAM